MENEQKVGRPEGPVEAIVGADEPPVLGAGSHPAPMPSAKDEWIARCAKRYIERAGMPPANAFDAARTNYEETAELGLSVTPEEAADDDMGYWSN